jgi:Protein of unknown function (DUF1549)/Protein of unknown function (DUF1553)
MRVPYLILLTFLASLGSVALGVDTNTATSTDNGEAAIDTILARAHTEAGIEPMAACDDSTFSRRVSLDLIGRVPTPAELKAFQDSGDRRELVRGLLASNEFPRYWSQLWATILVGRSSVPADRETLRRWLEGAFADRTPLNQIAFDLISAQGVSALDGPVNFMVGNLEDPVTPVSRIFLGVQLDCAQCHDHPYDRWTQDDHASMRKFFDHMVTREVSGGIQVFDRGAPSDTDDRPGFLTGGQPRTTAWRREMALMTVRSKPFARVMGNRIWQLLFGIGIIDPVDGLSRNHPPSVPMLHQALADQLRDQGFDLRGLIETICTSEAYGRAPLAKSDSDVEAKTMLDLFAARRLRPMLPEQLIVSYAVVMRSDVPSPAEVNELSVRFLGQSAAGTGACDPLDCKRTSQGLLQELAAETSIPLGDLDSSFLSTLSRLPDSWERERLSGVDEHDVLYALLHCNEFVFYR